MKATAWQFLVRLYWIFVGIPALFFSKRSYLRTTGWLNSMFRGKPRDRDRSEIPWMNYPTIAFLEERLHGDLRVFEFGSGGSTHFFARHAGQVGAVESDADWFERIRENLPPNATVLFRPAVDSGDYRRSIQEFDQEFDVIVVDGRDRVNCLEAAAGRLSGRGVIILDDFDRERYRAGVKGLEERGFRSLPIEGLKPLSYQKERTTIFYRDGNCLGI